MLGHRSGGHDCGMTKLFLFVPALLVAIACSSRASGPSCSDGIIQACECEKGIGGAQTCQDGEYGTCKCDYGKVVLGGTTSGSSSSSSSASSSSSSSSGSAGCTPLPEARVCYASYCGMQDNGCGGTRDCGGCPMSGTFCYKPPSSARYCCHPTAAGSAWCSGHSDGCGGTVSGSCFYGTCGTDGTCACITLDASVSSASCKTAARPRLVSCSANTELSAACTPTYTGSKTSWCCP